MVDRATSTWEHTLNASDEPGAMKKIVITNADLGPVDYDPSPDLATRPNAPNYSSPGTSLPGLGSHATPSGFQHPNSQFGVGPNPLAKLGSNSIISGLVAGAIGGALGMIVAEILRSPDSVSLTESDRNFSSATWVGIVGMVLGFVLLSWNGFTSGSPQKGARDGGIGAAIGLGSGFVGGFIAQVIYTQLLKNVDSLDELETKALIARVFAWAVFGVLIGAGIGLRGGPRKAINGLIGGAVGGLLGGFIFHQIEWANRGEDSSGAMLRFFGITITAIGIGVAIGIVDRIRRDSWLIVTAGPMAGKEFILFADRTSIGSDYRCDIVLVKDLHVAPNHLTLTRSGAGVMLQPSGAAPVTVNGAVTPARQLRTGDVIQVGSTTFSYLERAAAVQYGQ